MKKCKDCGSNVESGKSMCRLCLDKTSARMKQLRTEAIKRGLCGKCRLNKLADGQNRCVGCIKKEKLAFSERRKRYLSENKCVRCARDKSSVKIWTNTDCPFCHLKFKFKYRTSTKDDADNLINSLLEKQEYKCALTGRDLNGNKFHIDHIVPKSKSGENIPDNWQLIVEEANVFKTDLSMSEIIKLAKDIAKNFGE